MEPSLTLLRQTPQLSPAGFLAANPGCWLQYYDDTPAKNPAKTLRMRSFRSAIAACKQRERCAVCFSVQAFGDSLTREGLLCYRNLGVDVDLAGAPQRHRLSSEEMEARKNAYLESCLQAFPLRPHWLIETQHGFHAVFRVEPQRSAEGIRTAARINRRLIRALRGNLDALLVTQLLRVPGTYQFKDPYNPFFCRLLVDNASTIDPYCLEGIAGALDARVAGQRGEGDAGENRVTQTNAGGPRPAQPAVAEAGGKTVTAARRILGRLTESLWGTAAWGELREWNRNTPVPLPERELRSLFESVARETRERQGRGAATVPQSGELIEGVWQSIPRSPADRAEH